MRGGRRSSRLSSRLSSRRSSRCRVGGGDIDSSRSRPRPRSGPREGGGVLGRSWGDRSYLLGGGDPDGARARFLEPLDLSDSDSLSDSVESDSEEEVSEEESDDEDSSSNKARLCSMINR